MTTLRVSGSHRSSSDRNASSPRSASALIACACEIAKMNFISSRAHGFDLGHRARHPRFGNLRLAGSA